MHKARLTLPAIVYKVTNAQNGKFYIGVTTRSLDRRFGEHLNAAIKRNKPCHFHKAIRFWGGSAFSFEPLRTFLTAAEAMRCEIQLIAELKPHYNSTSGGDGVPNFPMSEERRRRIGDLKRGNKYCLGIVPSEKTREKLRVHGIARKDLFAQFSGLGPQASAREVICLNDGRRFESASAAAAHYGLPKSIVIEVCVRHPRRASAGGKVFRYIDDQYDAATEIAAAEKRRAEQSKNSAQKTRKPIICLNDGKRFPGAKDAAIEYGIHRSFIGEVCRGEKPSARGLRFAYDAQSMESVQ